MRHRFVRRFASPGLLGLALLAGCGSEALPAPADHLRASFPEHADAVLDGGEGFEAAGDGFATHLDAGALRLELPAAGEGWARFTLGGARAPAFTARVREQGAAGAGALAGRAVVYRRAGGASFWRTEGAGCEEWIMLDPPSVRRGAIVASWQIEGASLRRDGDRVLIADGSGRPWIAVTAPRAYAAGGRAVGIALGARGDRIELSVDADGEEVLIDPSWQPVPAPPSSISQAVLLPNGKVLAGTGASFGSSTSATTDLLDLATLTWSPTSFPHYSGAPVVLLPGGKVITSGGKSDFFGTTDAVQDTQTYDPATAATAPAAKMIGARADHTATALPDGRLLVAGGRYDHYTTITAAQGSYLASAEIYDPAGDAWASAGSLSVARQGHAAVLLTDGRVLVAGGTSSIDATLAVAEVYDPAANAWSIAASMGVARARAQAVVLPGGDVLVEGGGSNTAEVYHPLTDTWSPAAPPAAAHKALVVLQNGKVLALGTANGCASNADLYDPAANAWSAAAPMSGACAAGGAILLPSGKVLVEGGAASWSIYDPGGPLGGACAAASDCTSGFCADGVCCDTACNAGPCDACSVNKGAIADGTCTPLSGAACDDGDACTQGDTCQSGACVGAPRPDGAACDDGDACTQGETCQGGACVGATKPDGAACDDGDACTTADTCQAGACVGGSPVACAPLDACHDAGTCDPATGACSNPVRLHAVCANGDVCVAGACTPGVYWKQVASMEAARKGHTASLLPDGRVLVAGGGSSAAEIYDPAADAWSPAPPMSVARACHTATTLNDGRVLVVGGGTSAAEIFDPVAGTWSPAAPSASARGCHTATLLLDGRVLVDQPGEIYDPAANAWAPAAIGSVANADSVVVTLVDGRVLTTIPTGSPLFPSGSVRTNVYLPGGNSASPSGLALCKASEQRAARLPGGDVLVIGGRVVSGLDVFCDGYGNPAFALAATAQRYSVAADTWSSVAAYPGVNGTYFSGAGLTVLDDGRLLVAGGRRRTRLPANKQPSYPGVSVLASANAYDPAANTWSRVIPLFTPRADHTLTRLADGRVLAAGGTGPDGAALASAEILLAPPGAPCGGPDACASGFCVDGVCCDTACDGGACSACSIAKGATADGVCTPLTGTPCNDGNACTQVDTCQNGACVGGFPVVCPMPAPCHDAGTCNPANGTCDSPTKLDGSPCDDGNACTTTDVCQGGACIGSSPVTCPEPDECHSAGTCNSASGVCDDPAKPDGTPCSNGACMDGVCVSISDGGASSSSGSGGTGGASSSSSAGSGGDTSSSSSSAGSGGNASSSSSAGEGGGDPASGSGGGDSGSPGGCGCRVAPPPTNSAPWAGIGLLAIASGLRRLRRGSVARRA